MKKLSQEEAAKVLEGMKVKIEIPKAAVTQWKRNTALDMAIEALKYSEVPNSSDCISRQAAIDTEGLDEEVRCAMCRNQMKTDRGCDGNCKYDEKLYEKIMQILYERIKPLPSAEPEIIYCKDCKYVVTDATCCLVCDREGMGLKPYHVRKDDYCSYAERRTDG